MSLLLRLAFAVFEMEDSLSTRQRCEIMVKMSSPSVSEQKDNKEKGVGLKKEAIEGQGTQTALI